MRVPHFIRTGSLKQLSAALRRVPAFPNFQGESFFLGVSSLEIANEEDLHSQGRVPRPGNSEDGKEKSFGVCQLCSQSSQGAKAQELHLPQPPPAFIFFTQADSLEALFILVLLQHQSQIQKRGFGIFCIHVTFGAPPKWGHHRSVCSSYFQNPRLTTQRGCQDELGVIGSPQTS